MAIFSDSDLLECFAAPVKLFLVLGLECTVCLFQFSERRGAPERFLSAVGLGPYPGGLLPDCTSS